MPVEIPDLYSADVDALTTCGQIKTRSKKLHKWASDHEADWYCYRHHTAGGDLAIRVSLDSYIDEGRIHFHVEIHNKDWYVNGQLPETPDSVPPFDDLLAPFRGQKIDVSVFMDVPIGLSQAPSIIAVTANQAVSENNVSVRMTGGVLSVDGAPVEAIRWNIDPNDGKRVLVTLVSGNTTAKYSSTFFRECFDLVLGYASAFFRLGKTHA